MTYYQLNFFLFVILELFGVGADKETLADKDLNPHSICTDLTNGTTQLVAMGRLKDNFYVVDSNFNVLQVGATNLSINENNMTSSSVDLSLAQAQAIKLDGVASQVPRDSLKNGFLFQGELNIDPSVFPMRSLCFFLNETQDYLLTLPLRSSTIYSSALYNIIMRKTAAMTGGIVLSSESISSAPVYYLNLGLVTTMTLIPEIIQQAKPSKLPKNIMVSEEIEFKLAGPVQVEALVGGFALLPNNFFLFEPTSVVIFSRSSNLTASIPLKDFFKCGSPNLLDMVKEFLHIVGIGLGAFILIFVLCVVYFCCKSGGSSRSSRDKSNMTASTRGGPGSSTSGLTLRSNTKGGSSSSAATSKSKASKSRALSGHGSSSKQSSSSAGS